MNYTLQQLRYLVAVADHGNVSAAARSMYVSQSGVSAAISYLESAFGVQCFVRHHARGVTLTSAGQCFVSAARSVLMHADELQQRANELNNAARGPIVLGCAPTLGIFFLPRILEALRAMHPALAVQIHDGNTDSMLRWLRDGTIEVGFMYDLNCEAPTYSKHHLTSLRPYALLPESHPLAAGSPIRPADLADEPLILLNSTYYAEYLFSIFRGIGREPKIAHRVNNFELLRGLVAVGKGYSILNLRLGEDSPFDGRSLKCVPIAGESPRASIVLTSMPAPRPSRRVSALIDACNLVMQGFDSEMCRWVS